MATNLTNMRKNVRANLRVQLLLKGTDREGKPFSVLCQSKDFSRKGLGVLLDRDVAAPGSVVMVSSDNKFQSSASVQWVSRDKETGLYRLGLRLIEPKGSLTFKIAASLLLVWALLRQVSFAGPGESVRGASGRSGVPPTEQTMVISSDSGVTREEVKQLLRHDEAQPEDEAVDDSESESEFWVQRAFLAASESRSNAGRAELNIRMSKDSYGIGETIAASEYRLSNPSPYSQSVEIKTWLASPGISPISVGNVGADGRYVLPPGVSEDYGPVQLLAVAEEVPSGKYGFGARVLDPVTGDVLEEKIKPFSLSARLESPPQKEAGEAPLLDIGFQFSRYNYTYGDTVSLAQFRIANLTAEKATLELKIWLEVPGKNPIAVFSLGADGSLALTPGSEMNLEPLKSFKITNDLPAGTYRLKCKAMDPTTGQAFYENAGSFEVQ